MNISELISVLSQVSRELETAAVQHGSLTDISREAAQLQDNFVVENRSPRHNSEP